MCKNLSWLWLLSSPPATLYIIVEPPTSPMESQHLKPFRISNLFSLLNQSRISSIQLFQTFSGWSLRNDICEQIFKNECLEKEYPNVCLIVFWASLSNMPNPVYLKYSKLTWTCIVKFLVDFLGHQLKELGNSIESSKTNSRHCIWRLTRYMKYEYTLYRTKSNDISIYVVRCWMAWKLGPGNGITLASMQVGGGHGKVR